MKKTFFFTYRPDNRAKTVGVLRLFLALLNVNKLPDDVGHRGRDIGDDFWVPEIGSDNSCFLFILFLYPRVVPSRFSKRLSFLGDDFRFWS